jgi:UDP-N-acetylmuramate dehydrogenase
MVIPRDADDLVRALELCEARGLRWRVMGNGSNLLVSDTGVTGVVFKLRGVLDHLRFEGERVVAGAGVMLSRLVEEAAGQGLSGLEHLIGIPGTLGGALAMNAGSAGQAIGESVARVTFWQPGAGVCEAAAGELAFGYRDSILRRGGRVVLEAELILSASKAGLVEARMRELAARRRATQPLSARSAGSVFRNPEGGFAGQLMEAAGLKGERRGDAEVSTKHANFIINRGRATAADIRALVELARGRVRETSGIDLACEIVLWDD